ncbi:hypothetical protein [Mesorhizobium dulcispinae]|uniref:hypothetical protein n=1 Tax=Mesorhizobium dulcispinae TaxID=3072316 RepID=UPI002A2458F0|nr:hypothetical protein [Mesorhizobium sp. VK23D]MDX8520706.1 hypothetical protein [Mesorhizobium sp. VK23D]
MNTANHAAFADLSRPILSPLPLKERERLAGAWRMASQDIADDIRFIRQYLKVIAEGTSDFPPARWCTAAPMSRPAPPGCRRLWRGI